MKRPLEPCEGVSEWPEMDGIECVGKGNLPTLPLPQKIILEQATDHCGRLLLQKQQRELLSFSIYYYNELCPMC